MTHEMFKLNWCKLMYNVLGFFFFFTHTGFRLQQWICRPTKSWLLRLILKLSSREVQVSHTWNIITHQSANHQDLDVLPVALRTRLFFFFFANNWFLFGCWFLFCVAFICRNDFQFILGAPQASHNKTTEIPMVYLNKGQFYPITLQGMDSSAGIPCSKVKVS